MIFVLAMNFPREKLVLSIPTYGLSFLLEDPNDNKLGAPILTRGPPQGQTRTLGMAASYEVKRVFLLFFEKLKFIRFL